MKNSEWFWLAMSVFSICVGVSMWIAVWIYDFTDGQQFGLTMMGYLLVVPTVIGLIGSNLISSFNNWLNSLSDDDQ